MNWNQIKVVVFDLDGTLYEDTHHFDYYAERLAEKLDPAKAEEFRKDYHAALHDLHPLKIGRVYDVLNDLILVQVDGYVKEAYLWDGAALAIKEIQSLYPQPISINLETMLSVGDLWWVPGSIARHYGLNGEQSYAAFLETRRFMMTPEFQLVKVEGFKAALEQLRSKAKLVLMTNSPQSDSETILSKLDLGDVFHLKIFEAKKPILTPQRLEQIREQFQVDYHEILSVGDNWLNEILPAKRVGCSTIFIDPHHIGAEDFADVIVERIAEVIPYLKKIA